MKAAGVTRAVLDGFGEFYFGEESVEHHTNTKPRRTGYDALFGPNKPTFRRDAPVTK